MNNIVINTPLYNKDVIDKFGKLEDKKYIAVLDLELTCWSQEELLTRQNKMNSPEITEIGFVLLKNDNTYEEISRVTKVVKPIYNPILSEYCINLTGIQQEEINQSKNLNITISELISDGLIPNSRDFVWATWGEDGKWLQGEIDRTCYKQKNAVKFDPRVINIKVVTQFKGSLEKALKTINEEKELPIHRALPDALSTVKLLKYYNLTSIDALVSNEKTYKQTIDKLQTDKIIKLAARHNLTEDQSSKLLKQVSWDYLAARNIIKILKS